MTKSVDPDRIGDWMQTFTGRIFWPLDPRPDEVCIEDIAHSLSLLCRYNGHSLRFYSVAEHSVLVSHFVSKENALWGLLHDAAEAYSADLILPLKRCIPQWGTLETKIMATICDHFGMPHEQPEDVTLMDRAILTDERAALMAPCQRDWGISSELLGVHIEGFQSRAAEILFLHRFTELTRSNGG